MYAYVYVRVYLCVYVRVHVPPPALGCLNIRKAYFESEHLFHCCFID